MHARLNFGRIVSFLTDPPNRLITKIYFAANGNFTPPSWR
jgi:hypothetical protein